MRLFTILAVFLVAIGCGSEQSSELSQKDLKSYTLEDNEELVITFVGVKRGSLVDKSLLSKYDEDPEIYMHVFGSLAGDRKSFGYTPELSIPLHSKADTLHTSGEQIIVSAKDVNELYKLEEAFYIEFYENGIFVDTVSDRVDYDYVSLTSIFDDFIAAINLYKNPNKKNKAHSISVGSKNSTDTKMIYSLEVRKVEVKKEEPAYKSLDINVK